MRNENVGSTPEQFQTVLDILGKLTGQRGRDNFDRLSTPPYKCPQCRNERLLHYPFNKKGIIPA